MARALPPASFVREAPNNLSAVPVTATGHCPVFVRPRRAKTSFPGREAAPLRFAAPSAWVQKGSWSGLRSASASAVTLCWRGATPPSWLARPPAQRHCPPTHATGQEGGPGNTGNGFPETSEKNRNTEPPCGARCPPLRRWLLVLPLLSAVRLLLRSCGVSLPPLPCGCRCCRAVPLRAPGLPLLLPCCARSRCCRWRSCEFQGNRQPMKVG